jgi:hypothetical protein
MAITTGTTPSHRSLPRQRQISSNPNAAKVMDQVAMGGT